MTRLLPLVPLLGLAACAPSIAPDADGGSGGEDIAAGDATVDASSETDWVYLDLAGSVMVEPATPEDSTKWDLGFRRFRVKINGGVSGTAGMAVVPYFETPYDTQLDEPTDGWITDEPDDDDENEDPEYALDTWFGYDSDTHEVTAADVIYVVKDRGGNLVKLQFLEYYSDAGSPGYIHLRWGPLSDAGSDGGSDGDGGSDDGIVTCSSDSTRLTNADLGDGVTLTQAQTGGLDTDGNEITDWICWSFAAPGMVEEGWDLAMFKWDFVSGESEVAVLPQQDFDALTEAPADGYLTDTEDDLVFQDWYVYNTENHTLEPADIVWVVHTAAGPYYKMQLTTYYPDGDTDFEQPHHPAWKWAEIPGPK